MLVATWNVNGIRAREQQFLDWVARDQPDVVCLQETKASLAQLSPALLDLAGYHSLWHAAAKGYSGVSLHLARSRFPDPPRFFHPGLDMESRLVAAEVGDLVFESTYIPNGGKDYDAKMVFLRALVSHVRELHASGKTLVLCGDMNVARAEIDVHPKLREAHVIGQRPEERELIEALILAGLTDVGRALAPENDRLFTWWPYWRDHRGRNIGWRLDYIFVSTSGPLQPRSCRVLHDYGASDHAPVMADLGEASGDLPTRLDV